MARQYCLDGVLPWWADLSRPGQSEASAAPLSAVASAAPPHAATPGLAGRTAADLPLRPGFPPPAPGFADSRDGDSGICVGRAIERRRNRRSERLLSAVIAQAAVFGEMSADGLRGNFLLRVERKAHDVVLENLPWAYQWVNLPWMDELLEVQW